ncbi:MAG: type II toxin-antitoxin system RatA family toxin [Rhizobiales bacterium]|nr:type II toxin-antitoxin system RatA family toxin [Hyphomicrobiales bacterium]MBI3674636.1 type II toxin-antitoxin system RatA family toxin [Hyphomicrobiales bacterium]
MSKFSVARHVPFTADQVFAIASDVANYREFLPLVRKSTVRGIEPLADGRTNFEAELVFTYKKLGISETLVSRVIVDPAARTVNSTASEGPVKSLNVEWRIAPAPQGGCDIHFTVDYTLKSRALQFLLSGMFDMMVRRIMSSFEERARKLYSGVTA